MDLIKQLLALKVPDQLSLSPNGQQVTYTAKTKHDHKPKDTHHNRSIWLADTRSEKSSRRLTNGDFNDRDPQWAPDGQTIAFLSDRGIRGKSCAIYLVRAFNGGGGGDDEGKEEQRPKAITPGDSEQDISKYRFSPDGKHIFFIARPAKTAAAQAREEAGDDAQVWGEEEEREQRRFAHLYRVDVETGAVEAVWDSKVEVVNFALGDDGTEVAVVTEKSAHIESEFLHGCDITTFRLGGAKGLKLERGGRRRGERSVHLPRKLYDPIWCGQTLYFLAYNVPEASSTGLAVYAVDLSPEGQTEEGDKLKYRKVAYGEENCAQPGLRKAGGQVLVYVHHGMADQVRLLDGTILFSQEKSIFSYDAVAIPSNGSGNNNNNNEEERKEILMVVATGDINNPTEVFTVMNPKITTPSLTQLSDHGASFTTRTLAQDATFITCPTLDGKETVSALFLTPANTATATATTTNNTPPNGQAPFPTYVSIHGGPYYRITNTADSHDPVTFYAPFLLSAGIAVLIPDYRGSSGRGQRYASYAAAGPGAYYGTTDEPDIAALTQHAITLGLADPDRLAVGGWSQGGYLSYLSAVRGGGVYHGLGWRWRCAVPGAGVSEWDSMVLTSDIGYTQAEPAGCLWRLDRADVRTRQGSALWAFKEAVENNNIPPVLMVHGEQDPRVPVTQAWGFRRAMEEAGLAFRFVTYPREGHFIQETKHLEDLIQRVVGFVKEHLL
ncbi:hypothetical protein M406DRAFT_63267 [Cryphonectria parasitica EP155]|uniref:Dipeptidyl-peptidase V n=1 Tax=Cryphonectria parasitica (strain ATCC 38755 / EP155) TaxID=660469 RepID=A0A9P4XW14_CRYP1|nr:uncharacterized protein M406DRAFT_63267 [Cryphonectria parasitica EP155]KAF3762339.1 hypothetical protein M406DRAFT_63267 [Cryphonectria parasitica EP155]